MADDEFEDFVPACDANKKPMKVCNEMIKWWIKDYRQGGCTKEARDGTVKFYSKAARIIAKKNSKMTKKFCVLNTQSHQFVHYVLCVLCCVCRNLIQTVVWTRK